MLQEFELDALNMIILLELNGRALWLDSAIAKQDNAIGLGRLHVPFKAVESK